VPQVINGGIACFETAWVVGRSRRAGDCLSAINANATSADRSARLIINRTGIGRWAASFTDARWNQALTPPHVRRSESRHHPLDIVPWTYFLAHSPFGQFASILCGVRHSLPSTTIRQSTVYSDLVLTSTKLIAVDRLGLGSVIYTSLFIMM